MSESVVSYEVVGKLADGDVAQAFLARASGGGAPERFAVIKRIPRGATQNVELVTSFLDEARLAARLQHLNVAQVYEAGKLGGSYFQAMQYVNGETLRALVEHARAKKIQIPIRSIVTIAAGAAAGLHYAHELRGSDGTPLGIVHGDVSPSNLMVSRDGIVKLTDFGIARVRTRAQLPVPLDKLAYWSPEQCRGESLDRRSDLFSLGVVLWELTTLEELHHRGGDARTRVAIQNEDAAAPSMRRYDVPAELDTIIVRLLAKSPADRFQTGGELLAALDSLAGKLDIQLSTAELARTLRLWFGDVGDPVVPATDSPLVVRSEPVPADLAQAGSEPPSTVDEQFDRARDATAVIRAPAAEIAAKPRDEKDTIVPGLGDTVSETRESFEQIRDRILAQARKKKETMRPALATPAAETAAPAPAPTTEDASGPSRPKRETLNSTSNPYSFITNVAGKASEPVRRAGITSTPPLGTSSPADSHATAAALTAADATQAAADAIAAVTAAAAKANSDRLAAAAPSEASSAPATPSAEPEPAANADAPAPKLVVVDADAADAALAASRASVLGSDVEPAQSKTTATYDAASYAAAVDAAHREEEAGGAAESESAGVKAAKVPEAPAAEQKPAPDKGAEPRAASPAKPRTVAAEAPRAAAAREADAADVPRGRPAWLLPTVLAAGALGVVLVVMVMRGGDGSKNRNAGAGERPVASAPADARVQAPVQPIDAQVAATAPADAAEQVAAVAIDAGAAAAPIDAAEQVIAAPVDAAVRVADKPKEPDRPKQPDKPKDPDKPKEPEKTIEELVAAAQFAKANTACKTNVIFNSQRLTACTIAACNVKDIALAKRWVRAIAKAARPDLIKTCAAMGLQLEDAAPASTTPANE